MVALVEVDRAAVARDADLVTAVQLADDVRALAEPRLAPDGRRVAFLANQAARGPVVVVPAPGGPELVVTAAPPVPPPVQVGSPPKPTRVPPPLRRGTFLSPQAVSATKG